MRKTIVKYVANCDTCTRSKPACHAPFGQLKPLEVPIRRWSSVSVDFITGLPESRIGKSSFNAIMVVVDRLSKMAHYIPCRDTCTAEEFAQLFLNHVFRLHRLPDSIISDRGPQFIAQFTRALFKILKI